MKRRSFRITMGTVLLAYMVLMTLRAQAVQAKVNPLGKFDEDL